MKPFSGEERPGLAGADSGRGPGQSNHVRAKGRPDPFTQHHAPGGPQGQEQWDRGSSHRRPRLPRPHRPAHEAEVIEEPATASQAIQNQHTPQA